MIKTTKKTYDDDKDGYTFGGGGGEQWQLRWYITIHFFPFDDDNDGQMMATMDDGDKGR
jgi:hypothetical protein